MKTPDVTDSPQTPAASTPASGSVRIYEHHVHKEITMCDDCPFCDAMSVDCKAHAYCDNARRPLPADGQDGLKIMGMEIPEWCPLPKAPNEKS